MNFTKKEEILNEEIGRYSVRAEEDLSELRINYESLRRKISSISVGYDIDNIRYAITDLIENKYFLIENENLGDVDEKIRELSGKFDAIYACTISWHSVPPPVAIFITSAPCASEQ